VELVLDWLRQSGGLFLFNLLVQITVLAASALLIAMRFKHSPVSRYGVLYSAMLSLVLVLGISSFLQFKQTALFAIDVSAAPSSAMTGDRGFILETLPFLLDMNELLFNSVESVELGGIAESSPLSSNTQRSASWPLSAILLTLWIVGASVAWLGIVRSQIKLNRLIGRARTLTQQQEQRMFSALSNIDTAGFAVKFKLSPAITSPLLVGMKTPTILLPQGFAERLSLAQLHAVLLHELGHLKRRDVAANYIQKIIRGLFWFHPLVIAMDRRIDRAREEVCDNYALAKSDAVSYGEVLLNVGTLSHSGQSLPSLALGMHGNNWKLEDRVKGLLDTNRETDMNLSKTRTLCFSAGIFSAAVFISACQVGSPRVQSSVSESVAAVPALPTVPSTPASGPSAPAEARYLAVQSSDQEEPSEPLPPKTALTLSDEMVRLLNEIQSLMLNESEDPAENSEKLAQAKQLLDELTITRFDSLNDFEKASALNFLTNYYLTQEDYPNAAATFERIIEIDELRADIRLRAFRSLGQLTAALEQWQNSIDYYTTWRELAAAEDQLVFRGLSYAHYQLEQLTPAIGHWESYMALMRAQDMPLSRDDFAYLNGMYFTVEDLDKALEITKEMILNFNDSRDWNNLKSIFAMMDAKEDADQAGNELRDIVGQEFAQLDTAGDTWISGGGDDDFLPLVTVSPDYPTQAASDGIEGWVLVGFTVLEDGSVDEQTITVIDADPVQIFDLSSMRAVAKFEFPPRLVNGKAFKVEEVQYLFRYALEQDS
jgi:TonB family protein